MLPLFETEIFVTFLTRQQLHQMHQTEAMGDEYDFACIENTTIRQNTSESPLQRPVYAYLSRKGVFTIEQQQFTLNPSHNNLTGFKFKTQKEMLLAARDLLQPEKTLELFILQNITDEGFRRKNNDLLQSNSLPFLDHAVTKNKCPIDSLF